MKSKVSDDPNNLAWANDKSRFGFLMLQKMGWTEGAGLGKDGQGMKENIKVKKLADRAGLGSSLVETNGKGEKQKVDWMAWTIHKDTLDKLLSNLNARNEMGSESDSEGSSPTSCTSSQKRSWDGETDAEHERKRQKKEAKKQLKRTQEAAYNSMGLTEEEKAQRRAADKQQRSEARAAKRMSRRQMERGQ